MFKLSVSATAFGICNFFARLATVMAPFVAEMPDPFPIALLAVMCFSSSLTVLGIRPPKEVSLDRLSTKKEFELPEEQKLITE
jgi:hypothetical protein